MRNFLCCPLAMLMFSVSVLAQNTDDLARAMAEAKKQAAAVVRSMPPTTTLQPKIVLPSQISSGVNIEAVADQYRRHIQANPASVLERDGGPIKLFVSLSMPKESLLRLAQQAKIIGATVYFRGLKHGLSGGKWQESLKALKPIADTGADIQIHPELFRKFQITSVPTLVVASSVEPGACATEAVCSSYISMVGDVSLDYSLERVARRNDVPGKLAREALAKLAPK